MPNNVQVYGKHPRALDFYQFCSTVLGSLNQLGLGGLQR